MNERSRVGSVARGSGAVVAVVIAITWFSSCVASVASGQAAFRWDVFWTTLLAASIVIAIATAWTAIEAWRGLPSGRIRYPTEMPIDDERLRPSGEGADGRPSGREPPRWMHHPEGRTFEWE